MTFHQYNAYLRLRAGDEWGLTQGVTLGVTEGVTEGVPLGVDCADVVSLSSLKSPLGILNFCTEGTKTKAKKLNNVFSLSRMTLYIGSIETKTRCVLVVLFDSNTTRPPICPFVTISQVCVMCVTALILFKEQTLTKRALLKVREQCCFGRTHQK